MNNMISGIVTMGVGLIGYAFYTWRNSGNTESVESTENSSLSSEDAGQDEDTRVSLHIGSRGGPGASVSEVQAVRTCSPGMPDNGSLEEKNAVIHILKKQKAELGENRDQLTQHIKKNEEEKKENKMNLQQVENTSGLLKEKEDLEKITKSVESTENSPLSSEDAGQDEDTRVSPRRGGPGASVSEVQAVRTCSPGMPDNGSLEKNAVIHTLKKQKVELGEHRDQLTKHLKRNEEEKKENKMNLQQVENTPGLLKEKEDLLKVTWKLDEQQREYEKSMNHVDRLLQNINTLLSIAAK